jgi:hypothetical protein
MAASEAPAQARPRVAAPAGPPSWGDAPPPPSPLSSLPPPVSPGGPAQASGTNGFAIASLVLGIVWIVGLGSLLAVIFGVMAKNQIDRSGGRESGRGMAVAGVVLGAIGLAGLIVWIILIAAVASSTPTYSYSP